MYLNKRTQIYFKISISYIGYPFKLCMHFIRMLLSNNFSSFTLIFFYILKQMYSDEFQNFYFLHRISFKFYVYILFICNFPATSLFTYKKRYSDYFFSRMLLYGTGSISHGQIWTLPEGPRPQPSPPPKSIH